VATGGIILAAIMLLLFPVLIMFAGAIWSALVGWLFVTDAEGTDAPVSPAASE
jgi:hypothetical protein